MAKGDQDHEAAKMLEDIRVAANALAEATDTDVLFYSGSIWSPSDQTVVEKLQRVRRKNALLMLTTNGGDPSTGYAIARCIQEHYAEGELSLFVDVECMSTGTLIALGFDTIIMSDMAHLGPLDVQVRKRDEIDELRSGLTSGQALSALRQEAWMAFKAYFQLMRDMRFPTRLAVSTASSMCSELLRPVYQQLDPMQLAEDQRAVQISQHYGRRLSRKQGGNDAVLARLIGGYPSHGCIIDRKEAGEIFGKDCVRPPSEAEKAFSKAVGPFVWLGQRSYFDDNQGTVVQIWNDEPKGVSGAEASAKVEGGNSNEHIDATDNGAAAQAGEGNAKTSGNGEGPEVPTGKQATGSPEQRTGPGVAAYSRKQRLRS